jgi:hypothetical protein
MNLLDIPAIDLMGSDRAAATAARLEALAMKAAAMQVGTTTLCTVIYMVPGEEAVQYTWQTDYRGMRNWLAAELGSTLEYYGLTLADLFSASSPVKVAVGRVMPQGNTVTDGNWPAAMRSIPASFTERSLGQRVHDEEHRTFGDEEFVFLSTL